MGLPPVASVRSHSSIRCWVSGMDGWRTAWNRSAGAPTATAGLAHDLDHLERRACGARVGGKDHRVARIGRRYARDGRRHGGVCHGDEGRDNTCGFGVFHQPLGLVHLNHARRGRAQHIAQHHLDLEPFRGAPCAITDAAFIDALFGQPREGLLVARVPRNGLA